MTVMPLRERFAFQRDYRSSLEYGSLKGHFPSFSAYLQVI